MDTQDKPVVEQDPTGPEVEGAQPNEPAEGARDDGDAGDGHVAGDTSKIKSTHTPDERAFDL